MKINKKWWWILILLLALSSLLLISENFRSQPKYFPRFHIRSFKNFNSILIEFPVIVRGKDGYSFAECNSFNISNIFVKTCSVIQSESGREITVVCFYEIMGESEIKITVMGDRKIEIELNKSSDYSQRIIRKDGMVSCIYTKNTSGISPE